MSRHDLKDRLRIAEELLRAHHGRIEPDEAFATRVTARLSSSEPSRIGWAALRLLPATLMLLFVLAWLSWQSTPAPGELFEESPTDDLLTWVLDQERTEP